MARLWLLFILAITIPSLAYAQNAAPVIPLCGQAACSASNPVQVTIASSTPGSSSSGFSWQIADTPTVQAAAYASGNCIGGFRPVTVTLNNGQPGLVVNFRISSISGQIPAITIYLFDANPAGSTCTDKSTFTLAAADVDKLLAAPSAITLAAPTGTTVTMAENAFTPPRPFISGGSTGSGVKTIYYGLVSGSVFTPGSTTDIHTRVGIELN